jgi:DNA-binding transcriptional MerR regulator
VPDTDETFPIGELASRSDTTAETIRYYERIGLLPRPIRAGNGRYRRYVADDAARLRFVRRARALGFSIDEVREFIRLAERPSQSCSAVDKHARRHLEEVRSKIEQLQALETELQRVITVCGGGRTIKDCRILQALDGEEVPRSRTKRA